MRQIEYLNGEWNFRPDYENLSPEELLGQTGWEDQTVSVPSSWRWMIDPSAEFQPYDLFHYPRRWNDALAGLLSRKFTPNPQDGERVILVLKGVLQNSVIFVNGHKVLESCEAYLPLRVDISAEILPGVENTLSVWCGSFERIDTVTGPKVLAPNGSWFAQLARGFWQDVLIEYLPALSIQDVFVQTSTRKADIAIGLSLQNLSNMDQPAGLRVQALVLDGQAQVKEFEWDSVRITAGERPSLRLGGEWKDALAWSPEQPHLYRLQVNLLAGDSLIDQVEVRFGFREVWIEGHKFMLNGRRINLRGDAWHYQGFAQQTRAYAENWYKVCQQAGVNFIRLHAMPYPDFYLDAADEMGMLLIDESAIYGSSKSTASDHPAFLEHCRQHLEGLVLRDRNHPSVIIWSMQNEMRWVDGRDGYKIEMRDLSAAMKALDPTRPISYDGDNRLVDPAEMEIVSMHYNIDGTVASWKKDKPLIFGEHGGFHYVSPQGCTALRGPEAYLSYETCEDSLGWNEQLFIEYARRQEVTGITPFNMINYCAWSLPDQAVELSWPDPAAPGPKPRVIPAHALTVANGLVPGEELFRPNPAWHHLKAAFQPVAVFQNEYDSSFYAGRDLQRSFSIYNDTEHTARLRLTYSLELEGGSRVDEGQFSCEQEPGACQEWARNFKLPDVDRPTRLTLSLQLAHNDRPVIVTQFQYKVYPAVQTAQIHLDRCKAALIGDDDSFLAVSRLAGLLARLGNLTAEALEGLDLLVIGKNFAGKAADVQAALDGFVRRGGALLVLEQELFSLGDLSLSDRSFFSAFPSDPTHPVFNGLGEEDLRFWYPQNIHDPACGQMVQMAFHKPVGGDVKILLECGQGDFGWGGLLWTPLVEYQIGLGRIICSQLQLLDNLDRVPQAAALLGNLLAYLSQEQIIDSRAVGLVAEPGSQAAAFFEECRLDFQPGLTPAAGLVIVDPASLTGENAAMLRDMLAAGGRVLVLPASPGQDAALSALAGRDVRVEERPVYQLRAAAEPWLRSISPFDLTAIERVTYTPATYHNRMMCTHRLISGAGKGLLFNVQAPWEDFFIRHLDDEYRKVAIATLNRQAPFDPCAYGMLFQIGKGQLFLSQVLLAPGNPKVIRFYSRLLANLGARLDAHFLEYVKEEQDYSIVSVMALPKEDHQDYAAMLAYFSAPDYILNNLGEGVYGWMKRIEKREGRMTIPDSAGRICFVTFFVESEINRDPILRQNNELPDSSIVPDLFIDIDHPFQCFVNGREFARADSIPTQVLKVEDVVLKKGLNRIAMVIQPAPGDILLNAWFRDKFGGPVAGITYPLTVD